MRTARGAMRKAAGKDFFADLTLHSIKGITQYGNESEDGAKLVHSDHSAWPVQSGGACVQRQLQPYHTHVRATFQPSPNLPNHLHLP